MKLEISVIKEKIFVSDLLLAYLLQDKISEHSASV